MQVLLASNMCGIGYKKIRINQFFLENTNLFISRQS